MFGKVYLIGCVALAVFLPHIVVDSASTFVVIELQIFSISIGVLGFKTFK